MASGKEIEALIRVSGEVDKTVRQAIKSVSAQMDALQEAANRAQGSSADLSDTIRKQSKTLQAAQAQYASYVLNGQAVSDEAQDLANKIRELSSDLNKNKKALSAAESAAASLIDSSEQVQTAYEALSDTIKKQSNALKSAKTQYASYVISGQEASDEAKALADNIQRLSSDLNKNKKALSEAERATSDLEDAARNSTGGFTVMKGVLADLISSGIQKLVSVSVDAAKSLWGLSDSTREFRQDMATLETAYDKAGFSAETATDTWKDLYAIFGEDDRAVEAANNIARMADSQADLQQWTKITTGIWGTYQDAISVESLAEAAGESAKVGTVTGALADALNWSSEAASMFADYMGGDVVTAEDAFNVALSKCSSEQERQALITNTLTKLYGSAAEKYEETAGSIMDANKATADYSLNMAELGARIEPVTTSVQVGLNKILSKILELTANTDMQAMADSISNAFDGFINNVMPKIIDGLTWLKDNKDTIMAGVVGIGSAFAAWKVVGIVSAAVRAVKKFSTALSGTKTVMGALNVVMKANPIGIIITLVVGLVSAFIYLWNTSESFRGFWIGLWNGIVSAVSFAVSTVKNVMVSVWSTLVSIISAIWNGILNALNSIWNTIKTAALSFVSWVISTISSGWSALTGILTAPFRALFGVIDSAKSKISGLISSAKGIGSKVVGLIPGFAKGGFTNGISIAGEAGTEAVISFDPRYRADNLRYWAQAGRMLGADASDFVLSGSIGGTTQSVNIDNISFAPNITFSGKTDRESVVQAIREEYPEFLDMLEEWFTERGILAYD